MTARNWESDRQRRLIQRHGVERHDAAVRPYFGLSIRQAPRRRASKVELRARANDAIAKAGIIVCASCGHAGRPARRPRPGTTLRCSVCGARGT